MRSYYVVLLKTVKDINPLLPYIESVYQCSSKNCNFSVS